MRILLIIALLAIQLPSFSQECLDPLRFPDPNYNQCNIQYTPVCGCDGVTYRNECAAYNVGGLSYSAWTEGPCESFDFDFFPTVVSDNDPVQFYLYKKTPGSATLYVYSYMGGLFYTDYFYAPTTNYTYYKELPLQFLLRGIYIVIVESEGQVKYKKFAKQGLY